MGLPHIQQPVRGNCLFVRIVLPKRQTLAIGLDNKRIWPNVPSLVADAVSADIGVRATVSTIWPERIILELQAPKIAERVLATVAR